MSRYTKYVRRYALVWLTLILFDAHKYGCWLTGDATYWYPFCYWLVPLSLLPFLPVWVSWARRTNRTWTLKYFLFYVPLSFGMIAGMSGGHIFDVAWYDTSWFRHDDSLIAAIGLLVFALLFFLFCAVRDINPWEL